jgi:hypothetical protein
MHELARDAGVAFSPALPRGADYDIPEDLQDMKLKDKVKDRQPLSAAESLHIKRNYVHHSAHYSISKTVLGQLFGIHAMIPQEGNIRTIYPNNP